MDTIGKSPSKQKKDGKAASMKRFNPHPPEEPPQLKEPTRMHKKVKRLSHSFLYIVNWYVSEEGG